MKMKWSVKAVESLDNMYAFYAEIHPSIAIESTASL